MDDSARRRLLVAMTVSAALHLSLMFGLAVRAPSPPSLSEPILARIDRAGPPPGLLPGGVAQKTAAREARQATRSPTRPRQGEVVYARTQEPAVQAPAAAPADAENALPPVEMPLLTDPTWYPAAQLDVFPAALEPVRPAYPQSGAGDAGGEVTLLLLVDETGQVHECSVVDALPEGMFEEAALDAFRSARFSPGRKDGRSVRSRVLVKVVFNPAQALSTAGPQ